MLGIICALILRAAAKAGKGTRPPHRHREPHDGVGQGLDVVPGFQVRPRRYGSNVQVVGSGSVTSMSTASYCSNWAMLLTSGLLGT